MSPSQTEIKPTLPYPGLTRYILTSTDKSMLAKHVMQEGAVFPWHSHPHEQTVYLLEGEIIAEIEVDGRVEKRRAVGGESWVIPGNVPHQVTALKHSVALDFFVPGREDYL